MHPCLGAGSSGASRIADAVQTLSLGDSRDDINRTGAAHFPLNCIFTYAKESQVSASALSPTLYNHCGFTPLCGHSDLTLLCAPAVCLWYRILIRSQGKCSSRQ